MARRRLRSPLVPVVILVSASALACGTAESFDSASGCCRYACNGCDGDLTDCRDSGAHPDAVCTLEGETAEGTGCDTADSSCDSAP